MSPRPADARFVVQRHRASRLHYDFRLEIGGVLVSWAVPKGPTQDPKVRRAAFRVEDHPLDYLDFEGVIPGGRYGGGDVIVWDTGTWRPRETDDPAAAVAAGELHADLFGRKLRGRFVLIHTSTDSGGKQQWLLLHKHDDAAVAGWNPEDHPRSVLSGRTNEEVRADPDRLWRSDLPAAQAAVRLTSEPIRPVGEDELAALGALPAAGSWTVFGRAVRVSSLDRVVAPGRPGEGPVTKRELLSYTARIAPAVLPYLRHRSLLWRAAAGGAARPVVDEPADLVQAVNSGAVEWRVPAATVDAPQHPTHVLIELDQRGPRGWSDVLTLARLYRTALEQLRLRAYPELTGRRGIQLWIPIAAGPSSEQTRTWSEQLSELVGAAAADLLDGSGRATAGAALSAAEGGLLVPYGPRRAAGAPVALPIGWDELDGADLAPDRYTIRTVQERLADRGELFADALRHDQQLPRLG